MGGGVNLTWQDNSSDETGFEIERSATGGGVGFTQVGTTGANLNSYLDSSATSGTHYYRVRATNGFGDSAYTSEVSVVVP